MDEMSKICKLLQGHYSKWYQDELYMLITHFLVRLRVLCLITSMKKWVGKARRIPELDESECLIPPTNPPILPLKKHRGTSCARQEVRVIDTAHGRGAANNLGWKSHTKMLACQYPPLVKNNCICCIWPKLHSEGPGPPELLLFDTSWCCTRKTELWLCSSRDSYSLLESANECTSDSVSTKAAFVKFVARSLCALMSANMKLSDIQGMVILRSVNEYTG